MQEIEIKFKVKNIEDIKNKLLTSGCIFSEKLIQKDTIFVPDISDTSNGEGKMFVRVRSVNGKVELTLKKQAAKIMQSKEIEFTVSDFNSADDFLRTLGLNEWVTVEKERITTKYKGFNICIDEVKRLGSFIEIEIITEETDNTEYYEQQILGVAAELNIDIDSRVNSFYDTMISQLNEKNN